jgi:hypothetical protein
MEEFIKIETLIDHAKEYVNTRVDEIKLAVADKASDVIARLIVGMNGILHQLFNTDNVDQENWPHQPFAIRTTTPALAAGRSRKSDRQRLEGHPENRGTRRSVEGSPVLLHNLAWPAGIVRAPDRERDAHEREIRQTHF